MRRFFPLIVSLSLLFTQAVTVRAQGISPVANLYPVDASAFPTISAYLDVFDAQRIFGSGLTSESVSIIENGVQLPASSLTEIAVPLQIAVAVNQGTPLDARDANGISRYQRVAQVVAQWAQSRPADLPDDLSLVSQAGPVINHAPAADFIVGLTGFQPDMREAEPNLQSLATAIDVVSGQTPRLGMKRAVLFITPQMENPDLAALLEPYMQRAISEGIRIFVWYVDANTTFTTTSAAVFNNLAIQTGGAMFQYSGEERFPDPEAYFSALRRTYTLTYTSILNATGEYSVSVQANLPSGALLSNEQRMNVTVEPPNPFPITPPQQITRQAPADDPFNDEILLPTMQQIEILVEFPDGHPRPLTRTTLYIDGQVAAENIAEPFNIFTWDLNTYTESGDHQLSVEAVDSLGLSKASMPIPVTLTVIKPPSGPAAFLAKYRTQLTFGSIILAGLVLFAILLSGRFRIPTLRQKQEARKASADPLTQPISIVAESISPGPKRKQWTVKSKKIEVVQTSKGEPAAYLLRLNADGQPATVAPLQLIEKEIVFGTDPVQCNQIIDHPSISSVHARLRLLDDGTYLLLDNNSTAGTWINYEPALPEGYRLAHGDMVNFGQLIYRFMLKTPPPVSPPTVTVIKTDE